MISDTSLAFLKTLLDTPGPSGFEAFPARVWREEAARFTAAKHRYQDAVCALRLRGEREAPRLQNFGYSRRKPSPQRLIWPTEGDGKCIVQHSVSVSQ